MKLLLNVLVLVTLSTLITSCLSRTAPPANSFYDLTVKVPATQVALSVGTFTAESQYSTKMVFRTDENKVEFAHFHRWANNPEELLKNYCQQAFSPSSDNVLDLHILRLELSEPTSSVIFVADYTINNQSKRFSKQIRINESSPAELSRGFNIAADALIETIHNTLK